VPINYLKVSNKLLSQNTGKNHYLQQMK